MKTMSTLIQFSHSFEKELRLTTLLIPGFVLTDRVSGLRITMEMGILTPQTITE